MSESLSLDRSSDLGKLIDLAGFREVCRTYAELFGVGIRVFDMEGRKLVDVRIATADHCGYLFTVHPTKVLCTSLVNEIRSVTVADASMPLQFDCFSGLRYKVVPIFHEGSAIGRVIFGPYAPQSLREVPKSLEAHVAQGLDLGVLARFQDALPRMDDAAVERVLETLGKIIGVIVHSGYRAHLTSQMHIASITAAFDDVRKTNSALADANQKLQELDRLKSNFIATVSHELRTPLTSVIGYSEMLLEGMAGELNGEQKHYMRTILEKGESLLQLIAQVLDLARIESGNAVVRREPTDIRDIIKLSVSDVLPQAQSRNVSLSMEIASDLAAIPIDQDKIRRIVTNLLGNAVKFTNTGGAVAILAQAAEAPPAGQTTLDIFQPERNAYLAVSVRDTGIGIPHDKLDQIFESFFQVDNSSTREFGGSGLGLSIARNFAQAHGGHIRVTSQVNQGSTFTLMLPYHPDRPQAPARIDGLVSDGSHAVADDPAARNS